MRPPIASLLLSVSLALSFSFASSFAFAPPSAADPQLDEPSAADLQLEQPSDTAPQFAALSDALRQRLSEQVDGLLSQHASAALEEQIDKLATRNARRVAKAPDGNGQMRCNALRDSKLDCAAVAMRSEAPSGNGLSTLQP